MSITERIYLKTYEDFEQVLLPIINAERKYNNLPELSDDEAINVYIEKRKEYGLA